MSDAKAERPRSYVIELGATKITITGPDADQWADAIAALWQRGLSESDRQLILDDAIPAEPPRCPTL